MEQLLLLLLIGICAGVLGGMAGVGGGVIIVPALMFILGFSQHSAQGTSTATLLFPIGVLAAYNYHKADAVNWKFAIIMAIGFVLGGYIGSKFALSLDAKVLKRFFAIFLIVIAAKVFWDSFKIQT